MLLKEKKKRNKVIQFSKFNKYSKPIKKITVSFTTINEERLTVIREWTKYYLNLEPKGKRILNVKVVS